MKPPIFNADLTKGVALSVEGSANAPFLWADHIGSHGIVAGNVVSLSLEAHRSLLISDGNRIDERVVVAHLRLSMGALLMLEEAIKRIKVMAETLAQQPTAGEKN